MEQLLLFIKHNLGFIWRIIEYFNAALFSLKYSGRLRRILPEVMNECSGSPFVYRVLQPEDMDELYNLIHRQNDNDLKYFQPHGFEKKQIMRMFRNRAFLMMGAFEEEHLAGYFFLRFFINGKCFVGRLIDKPMRGKGIGQVMNYIMYETAWRLGFRCMSTVSKRNTAVMRAHEKNRQMVVIRELKDDYLLVEFIK